MGGDDGWDSAAEGDGGDWEPACADCAQPGTPRGWRATNGSYFCLRCWSRWQNTALEPDGKPQEDRPAAAAAAAAAPGGPACGESGGAAAPAAAAAAAGWRAPNGAFFCGTCWAGWLRMEAVQGRPPPPPPPLPDGDAAAGGPARRPRLRGGLRRGCGCRMGPMQAEGRDCPTTFRGSPWWDGRGDEACKVQWSNDEANADEDAAFADSLSGAGYIDSHCHLDSCVQNEKYGDEIWTMKKWICYRWKAGYCWYGDNCQFAHGEESLVRLEPIQPQDLERFAERHPTRRQRAGPHMRWLIHNCCEAEAIADTLTLVAAGDRLLGGRVVCTFGCHPHMYEEYGDAMEAELLRAVKQCGPKAVAWGECGLDYYKNFYDAQETEMRSRMVEVFARQARLAAAKGLPLVVHSRDAEDDTMAVLTTWLPREHPLHLHAFQGSPAMVAELLRLLPNAVVGISGAVFGVEAVTRVVEQTPLDRMVLETDAPYLSNEPRDIPSIARAVAQIKGIGAREVLLASARNSERVYRLGAVSPAEGF